MGLGIEAVLLGSALAASAAQKPKMPSVNIPSPEKPPAPQQGAKAADRHAAMAKNMYPSMSGGAMSGNSGTFLTGAEGVDPDSLKLGKNTLLGQ